MINLKDYKKFLIDFGMVRNIDPKLNIKEITLQNELWKSLRQYGPTESEKIHEKHLKTLMKAMVGLAPL